MPEHEAHTETGPGQSGWEVTLAKTVLSLNPDLLLLTI